jgi:hypothetical protein
MTGIALGVKSGLDGSHGACQNGIPMARTSSLPLYNRALDGQLFGLLRKWSQEDVPLEEIVFRLRSEHDIKVSGSTVRRWLRELETP